MVQIHMRRGQQEQPSNVACTNRLDNVKFWMKEFPDWDHEAANTSVGGKALGLTLRKRD